MAKHPGTNSSPTGSIAVVLVAIFFAIILSIIISLFPTLLVIALAILVISSIITVRFPVLGFVILLAIVFGIINEELLPSIPLAGGSFHPSDFLLGIIVIIVALQSIGEYREIFTRMKPLSVALGLISILTIISVIVAYGYFRTPITHTLGETRTLSYWLILPVFISLSRNPKNFRLIINGLLSIAFLLAMALIFQHLTGIRVLGGGRVEQLVTVDKVSDAVRVTTPGIYIICFGIIYFLSKYLAKKQSGIKTTLLCLPLFLGVLVTFGRGIWLALSLTLVILSLSYGWRAFIRSSIIGLAAISILGISISFLKPDTYDAVIERFSTISESVEEDSSLDWRYQENYYAIEHLKANPLFGVGLGGIAHPKFNAIQTEGSLRYIHCGYLYLTTKLGVLSILFPILIFIFLVKTTLFFMKIDQSDLVTMGRSAAMVILLLFITSISQPEWMVSHGISTTAVFLGITLYVLYNTKNHAAAIKSSR